MAGGQADFLEESDYAIPAFVAIGAQTMDGHGFDEGLLDGKSWIERGVRILKDDLHALPVGK